MSFGRLTTAQIESGPLRKTQRTTARSPLRPMLQPLRMAALYYMQTSKRLKKAYDLIPSER